MRAPRDGNAYQDRRQDDRGNRGSQDNLRGAGHPGGRGWTSFSCYNIVLDASSLGETCVVKNTLGGGGERGRGDRGGRGGGR